MNLPLLVKVPALIAWKIKKQNPLIVISTLLLVLAICWNFGADYYTGKWAGFGIALVFITGIGIYRRFGLPVALLISLCLLSAIWIVLDNTSRYAHVVPYDLQALRFFSAEAALKLYMVIVPFLLIKIDIEKLSRYGRWLSCAFLFISIGQVFWEAAFHGCSVVNSCGGALGNPSLNAGMMAVCLPIVFEVLKNPYKWLVFIATLAAIALGRANSGIFLVAAFLLIHLTFTRHWRILAIVPVVAFCGWFFLGPKFMSSGDRFMMWKFFMSKWATNPLLWGAGSGFGTFGVFSVNLQRTFDVRAGVWWLWMHNDWLQGVFEVGIIGGLLMIWTYTAALIGLFRRQLLPEMQALILYGIFMGGNYALHVGLTCVFLAWLLALALYKTNQPLHNET